MQPPDAPGNADWIDPVLYPYVARAFPTPAGTMRYVDEGEGPPVVMVHGNPAWSFTYRKLIDALRPTHRCIAPDHIGFGQSDKPPDWSYLPADHAANLMRLLDALDLEAVTLVVQDWGGPIGLAYAVERPERIDRLVILNTWCWSVRDERYYRLFSGFMGGSLGRLLCRRLNLFVRGVVPMTYGDRSKLTADIMHHYRAPLPTAESRKGTWVFPGEIIGSSDWLAGLWERRDRFVDRPTLLAWGMKDIAFREDILRRWIEAIPHARVQRFEDAGHFLQDEAGEALAALVRRFLAEKG